MKTRANSQRTRRNEYNAKTSRHQSTPVVMDVLPWPDGSGFSGVDSWWHQVLGQSECERLNNLIGLALLDSTVCEQLVVKRDPALFATFGLSERTQNWLSAVGAATLKELAQAIVAANNLFSLDFGSAEAA
jgi:hypothetical protein